MTNLTTADDINSLETLRDAMIADHPAVLDHHAQWSTGQMTFGGEAPADTSEVWSWDESRVLAGTCADNLNILSREEWAT